MLVRDLKHLMVARHNGQTGPGRTTWREPNAPKMFTKVVIRELWDKLVQEDPGYLNIPIRVNIFYNNMNTQTQAFWCPSVIRELYECKR